jgi:glycosyltransferase involved in cell wall biosynthesis
MMANSSFTQERMKATFGIEIPVSSYGVDLEDFSPLNRGVNNNHVLSVGEISPRKGFDFLIKSLSYLPSNQRPALRLASNRIEPQEFDYLQRLAEKSGVQLQVKSNLDASQLRKEYSEAKFCVYAPVLEPFGLVPLEAMACGVPVIGVLEGGVPESIVHERTGLLVERDPERFAGAMQHLLTNPDLAQEYGRNAREHVLRNWTWDHSTDSVESHLMACAAVN